MSIRRKSHKDVEFHVDTPMGTKVFKHFDEAAGLALVLAISDGHPHKLDCIVHSVAGARWLSGDDGAKSYREDPDATVFSRIIVRGEEQGRIA